MCHKAVVFISKREEGLVEFSVQYLVGAQLHLVKLLGCRLWCGRDIGGEPQPVAEDLDIFWPGVG